MTAPLESDDVQGLLMRAYGHLPAACFLLVEVADAARAANWLAESAGLVARGSDRQAESAVNVGLTAAGLRALGLDDAVLTMFANEFFEGMVTPFRQRLLGDTTDSDPGRWQWGGLSPPTVHGVILLYAIDDAGLARLREAEILRAQAGGLRIATLLETVDLHGIEHFGFHDGISQPPVAGLKSGEGVAAAVPLGEFVLGYANAYGLLGERPVLTASADPSGILPPDAGGSGGADLGRNGSYLVIRQLRQDVRGFWRFVDRATRGMDGATDPVKRTRLAAMMVGRWPSGAPLVLSPDRDDVALADANDFRYHAADPEGLRCPIGAHVRRANPRDSLDPRPGSARSLEINNHHRILRRGREYGAPVDPATLFDDVAGDAERGLHFMCLNASIRRQFEFIQHTWVNSSKFAGLYDDEDPLLGPRQPAPSTFTVPATPVRARFRDLPRFVTTRGGAYVFLPGVRALRFLATVGGA